MPSISIVPKIRVRRRRTSRPPGAKPRRCGSKRRRRSRVAAARCPPPRRSSTTSRTSKAMSPATWATPRARSPPSSARCRTRRTTCSAARRYLGMAAAHRATGATEAGLAVLRRAESLAALRRCVASPRGLICGVPRIRARRCARFARRARAGACACARDRRRRRRGAGAFRPRGRPVRGRPDGSRRSPRSSAASRCATAGVSPASRSTTAACSLWCTAISILPMGRSASPITSGRRQGSFAIARPRSWPTSPRAGCASHKAAMRMRSSPPSAASRSRARSVRGGGWCSISGSSPTPTGTSAAMTKRRMRCAKRSTLMADIGQRFFGGVAHGARALMAERAGDLRRHPRRRGAIAGAGAPAHCHFWFRREAIDALLRRAIGTVRSGKRARLRTSRARKPSLGRIPGQARPGTGAAGRGEADALELQACRDRADALACRARFRNSTRRSRDDRWGQVESQRASAGVAQW